MLAILIIHANLSLLRNLLGPEFLLATITMGGAGTFFLLISYRLLLNRGARVGRGLFSPVGWRLLGSLFVALTIFLTASAVWRQDWGQLIAPIFGVVFASWCFSTAKKYSHND